MPSRSSDAHFKKICRCHTGTAMNANFANIHAGPIMHSPNGFHVKPIKQPILDHRFAAIAAFFSWLKDEIDSAVEITRFREILRRAKKHRAMPVMPTSMHPPWCFGHMGKFVHFLHWQRVHIGPQSDCRSAIAVAAQNPNNASFAHATMNFDAK